MKNLKHLIRVGALGATLVLAGCSGGASETLAEKALESQTGGEVDIDTSGEGAVKINTDEGSVDIGGGAVPDGWPGDVPVPEGLKITSSSAFDTADGKMVMISATTSTPPAEILAAMKETLSSWKIEAESTMTDGSAGLQIANWELDGRRVTFSASGDGEGNTSLNLGHQSGDATAPAQEPAADGT